MRKLIFAVMAAGAVLSGTVAMAADQHLLNVSYSPTRELYKAVNPLFVAAWKAKTGNTLTIDMSYGGSGSQSRAVVDGLDADVATLGVEAHINAIAKAGLTNKNWKTLLPDNSAPYTSTIVFLVRKGNPKHIKDWADLVKPDVKVITPNPKTSGAAQLAFLAAWIYAEHQPGGNDKTAQAFVSKLYHNVPVLDTSGRNATITFTRRGVGDVLLGWENEAHLALKEQPGQYEIVYPASSILAEPPVSVVTKNAQRHGTTAVAEAYLKFLYTSEAQEIEAKTFYRPRDPKVLAKFAAVFPKIKLYTVQQEFGGWPNVEARFFGDGKIFDQIYKPGR
jgi:sulfate transport system substrate-binding protein